MKIVSINCPGCGAPIKFENVNAIMFCQFCGAKMLLDDEIKKLVKIQIDIKNVKNANEQIDWPSTQEAPDSIDMVYKDFFTCLNRVSE